MLHLYSDGGARGNPGPAGAGFVIKDDQGAVLMKQAVFLGPKTNNQAEYYGLLKAVIAAKKLGTHLLCHLDSQLVVRQMLGEYKIKDATLKLMAEEIRKHAEGLDIDYRHIPREENGEADEMANLAMDRGEKPGDTFTFSAQ